MRSITLLLLATLALSGCSWMPFVGDDEKDSKESETEGYTEQDFYEVIQRDLRASRWENAIENLQALEAQFPFGAYAEQAQLELIYAYHRAADYEAAKAAADRFIRLHPRHPNVDYAYYLKGMSSLRQSRGFLDTFLPTDFTSRDPGTAREAFGTFSELLDQYPNSSYAADARKRMVFLRNLLARYEIHVANLRARCLCGRGQPGTLCGGEFPAHTGRTRRPRGNGGSLPADRQGRAFRRRREGPPTTPTTRPWTTAAISITRASARPRTKAGSADSPWGSTTMSSHPATTPGNSTTRNPAARARARTTVAPSSTGSPSA